MEVHAKEKIFSIACKFSSSQDFILTLCLNAFDLFEVHLTQTLLLPSDSDSKPSHFLKPLDEDKLIYLKQLFLQQPLGLADFVTFAESN